MFIPRTYRAQVYATVVANLSAIAYGIALGWSSPILPLLLSPDTPLAAPLNVDQASWIASVSLIGGMLATPLYGWSAERFGRKLTILMSVVPQLLSWVVIEFSSSAVHLYIARFLVGFGGTGFYLVVPMYVAEIASNSIRGRLGSLMIFSKNLGLVIGYAINSYLDYYTVPFIVITLLVTFFVGFQFVADSPKHLMVQQRSEEAVAALKFFRGYAKDDQQFSKDFHDEMEALKNSVQTDGVEGSQKLRLADFGSRSAVMAILIGSALQYLEVMNGCTSITSYSETIFREAGSTLSPALSTVIMGVIFLMGSYISATFVDKAGRKILMITSATGCGINLSIVAGYSYLRRLGFDVSTFGWIPLCCLSLFMLLASVGVISLHMVISSEILAQKIRGPVLSFFIIENWMISFLAVKYFPVSLEFLGMHGCMLTFALTCFGGALFVLLVLPETKGKSIETIVQGLEMR